MTRVASLCESLGHMVRIGGVLEIREVTRNAGVCRQIVIIVDVAIGTSARRHRMHAGQREVNARVVESCRSPARGRVAGVTRC